jgi:hypothetical protein
VRTVGDADHRAVRHRAVSAPDDLSRGIPAFSGCDTPGLHAGFASSRNPHVTYYLFAPQGCGEAQSLPPSSGERSPSTQSIETVTVAV